MPAMAARSPEPAKRCAKPQSLRASDAGRRRDSISAITSMAAERRAAGVIASRAGQDLDREQAPHDDQDHGADAEGLAALRDLVAGHKDGGMDQAREHEQPGQH